MFLISCEPLQLSTESTGWFATFLAASMKVVVVALIKMQLQIGKFIFWYCSHDEKKVTTWRCFNSLSLHYSFSLWVIKNLPTIDARAMRTNFHFQLWQMIINLMTHFFVFLIFTLLLWDNTELLGIPLTSVARVREKERFKGWTKIIVIFIKLIYFPVHLKLKYFLNAAFFYGVEIHPFFAISPSLCDSNI